MDHRVCGWPRAGGLNYAPATRYFAGVGRTYLFECPQCQYRALVSGGADGGRHCDVQTVICRDCRQLFDVLLRVHRRVGSADKPAKFSSFSRPDIPPVVLGESSFQPARPPLPPLEWRAGELACPVSPKHFVEPWNDPGRCPRCGNFLEKNGLPFRLWD